MGVAIELVLVFLAFCLGQRAKACRATRLVRAIVHPCVLFLYLIFGTAHLEDYAGWQKDQA